MYEAIKDFFISLFSGFKTAQSDAIRQNTSDLEAMKEILNDDNKNSDTKSK